MEEKPTQASKERRNQGKGVKKGTGKKKKKSGARFRRTLGQTLKRRSENVKKCKKRANGERKGIETADTNSGCP